MLEYTVWKKVWSFAADDDKTPEDGYDTITDFVYQEVCKYSTRSCITENQDPSSRERMEKFRYRVLAYVSTVNVKTLPDK
jgi:hypothetical protein